MIHSSQQFVFRGVAKFADPAKLNLDESGHEPGDQTGGLTETRAHLNFSISTYYFMGDPLK